jgi:hypothetical protein
MALIVSNFLDVSVISGIVPKDPTVAVAVDDVAAFVVVAVEKGKRHDDEDDVVVVVVVVVLVPPTTIARMAIRQPNILHKIQCYEWESTSCENDGGWGRGREGCNELLYVLGWVGVGWNENDWYN